MSVLGTGDWILLAAAAYLAVMSLARLMLAHRTATEKQLALQVEEERRRKAALERQAEKEKEAA